MEERILDLLGEKDYVPLSAENLQRHLRVPPDREPEFNRALRKLERDGAIALIKASRYVRTSDADMVPGRIRMNPRGQRFSPAGRFQPQGNCHPRERHRHIVE